MVPFTCLGWSCARGCSETGEEPTCLIYFIIYPHNKPYLSSSTMRAILCEETETEIKQIVQGHKLVTMQLGFEHKQSRS